MSLELVYKISENGRNIYESNQNKSIKLYSKLISIELLQIYDLQTDYQVD